MRKVFIVTVDGDATREQRDAFTDYVRELNDTLGVGFWHHLTSTWLVSDSSDTLTVTKLRDKVNELMPSVNVVVLSTTSFTPWAVSAPKAGHAWLHKHIP